MQSRFPRCRSSRTEWLKTSKGSKARRGPKRILPSKPRPLWSSSDSGSHQNGGGDGYAFLPALTPKGHRRLQSLLKDKRRSGLWSLQSSAIWKGLSLIIFRHFRVRLMSLRARFLIRRLPRSVSFWTSWMTFRSSQKEPNGPELRNEKNRWIEWRVIRLKMNLS